MTKKNYKPRKPRLSREAFIRIWQNAEKISTVYTVAGVSRQSVQVRAVRLRKQGIPLKRFTNHDKPESADVLKREIRLAKEEIYKFYLRKARETKP